MNSEFAELFATIKRLDPCEYTEEMNLFCLANMLDERDLLNRVMRERDLSQLRMLCISSVRFQNGNNAQKRAYKKCLELYTRHFT